MAVLTHCQILRIDLYSTRAISVGGIFGGIYLDVNIKHSCKQGIELTFRLTPLAKNTAIPVLAEHLLLQHTQRHIQRFRLAVYS